MLVVYFSVVFFFKQKTAYEMRISDWSSDVCSSDLITDVALLVAKAKIAQLEAQIEKTRSTLDGNLATLGYTKIYAPMAGTVIDVVAFEGQTQIGRASCRERVCQYV